MKRLPALHPFPSSGLQVLLAGGRNHGPDLCFLSCLLYSARDQASALEGQADGLLWCTLCAHPGTISLSPLVVTVWGWQGVCPSFREGRWLSRGHRSWTWAQDLSWVLPVTQGTQVRCCRRFSILIWGAVLLAPAGRGKCRDSCLLHPLD